VAEEEEEGLEPPEKVAAEEAVPDVHAVPVCDTPPEADTDAEELTVGECVAERLYVTVPVIDREKVGDVEPECVTDADGLSVPDPQGDALLEGEGVPVEECDTEPEREPCAAEGVDAGEVVAVSVLAIVKVPLTLGEAEVDTVADEVEKREGVDAAEGVAEAEDTGVFERVAEGDREMEPVTVAETEAAAELEVAALPVATRDSVAPPEGVESMVGEAEKVSPKEGVFCPNVGDTETLTVAVKVAVTVTDTVAVLLVENVAMALEESTLLLLGSGVTVDVVEAEKVEDREADTLVLGEEVLSREAVGHMEGLPEPVWDLLSVGVTVSLKVTRAVAELVGDTVPLNVTVEDTVLELLTEVKREGVESPDPVAAPEEETETLADTEWEPLRVGDADTEGVSERTAENEGDALDEKKAVAVTVAEMVPVGLATPVAVRAMEGDTEGVAETVGLELKVDDTDMVAVTEDEWHPVAEGDHSGDCVLLCESEREPV
jgi:hypothetical protein